PPAVLGTRPARARAAGHRRLERKRAARHAGTDRPARPALDTQLRPLRIGPATAATGAYPAGTGRYSPDLSDQRLATTAPATGRPMTFTLPAPAKLNLYLHIPGRRADGYHTLEPAFQLLDYGDLLDFRWEDGEDFTMAR